MDGEIVVLCGTTNDRICEIHSCCGESIQKDNIIIFKLTAIDGSKGIVDKDIKAVKISNGTETCVGAYLPRHIVQCIPQKFVGKFSQIIKLYDSSDNLMMRYKINRNLNMVSFFFAK